jgi:RNA-directed DNA polymerase
LLSHAHLPQGAPTSPALANLAAFPLDVRLTALARSMSATYTRYADDLFFSGDAGVARAADRLHVLVAAIALDEGFSINTRKTRVMRRGVRQRVTSIVVNDHPNIERREVDRLKAILTNCVRLGPQTQNREGVGDFRAHLAGRVAWVSMVTPARGAKLAALFRQIDWSREHKL